MEPASAGIIYKKYYEINYNDYHSIHFVAAADSPDKEHAIGVTAYKTDVDADVVYICMVLYNIKTDSHSQGGKIILWDKVPAADVHSFTQEADGLKYSIYAEWISNENILVNGRIVNIDKGFDYRRDFKE